MTKTVIVENGPDTSEWTEAQIQEHRSVEDIQRRCRAAAERFEALAGPARVEVSVSADLLLEAASLLRGYHQSLLVQALPKRQMSLEEKRLHDAATVPGFDPARDGAQHPRYPFDINPEGR